MSAERGRMRIVGVLAVALGACADGEAAAGRWTGVVDTLSTGTVEVRNPQTGRWTGDSGWALVEDLRIGALQGADPARIFGRIGDIEVDAAGRIWVLDTDAAELRVFEGDGRHRVTFGRRGEGPGEFSRPAALVRGPDDRIWVVDTGNHRYMIFDAGKGLVEEKRRFASGAVAPWPGAVLDDGRVVDVELESGRRIYTVHDPAGRPLDTLTLPRWESRSFVHTTESSRVSARVPFSPGLHRFIDPRGHLWTGISEDYRIVRRSLDGTDSLRIVRRTYEPVPVSAAERAAAIEGLRWFREQGGRIDVSDIPDRHPAFRDFLVDRLGYLWVLPITRSSEADPDAGAPQPGPTVFDVFDEEGAYLGRLGTPARLGTLLVTGQHVYGSTLDELGVPYVVRFRIEGRDDG